jgi:hypothetical protein
LRHPELGSDGWAMNSIQRQWKIKSTEVGRCVRIAVASKTWGNPEQTHDKQKHPHADADHETLLGTTQQGPIAENMDDHPKAASANIL